MKKKKHKKVTRQQTEIARKVSKQIHFIATKSNNAHKIHKIEMKFTHNEEAIQS